jgi:osmotically-inducible protein OsmY
MVIAMRREHQAREDRCGPYQGARRRAGQNKGRLFLALSALGLIATTVSACTPVGMAIGAGATVANTASEERGLDGATVDTLIDARVRDRLTDLGHGLLSGIGVTVRERRVLLTGRVPSENDHQQVLAAVAQVENVSEILDSLILGPDEGLVEAARDRLIAEDLSRDLLFDAVIKSVNYVPVVSDRVVYLMGIAQDQAELDRVIVYARNVSYVHGVVSLVRLRTDPRRLAPGAAVSQVVITPVVFRPGTIPGGVYRFDEATAGSGAAQTGYQKP